MTYQVVNTLSNLSPVHWAISGIDKTLRGQDFSTIIGELMILPLFAIVFFLLGIMRKVDIAK